MSTTEENSFISASNVSSALNMTSPQPPKCLCLLGQMSTPYLAVVFISTVGPVTIQQNKEETRKSSKRRRLHVIDSDVDD